MTKIEQIAVIGAGTMGRMISLQIARHSYTVTLYDLNDEILDEARQAHHAYIGKWIESGDISIETSKAVLEHVRFSTDLLDAVRDADLAIEAVPELLDVKRIVFKQLDAIMRERAIIATNSSSIRVSLLEDATERPEQVANFHFYTPVWDSPMVEVGGGTQTSSDVLESLTTFAKSIAIFPLRVQKESTGFIFNRVWRAIKREVLEVADSGVASFQDIDRAWMIKFGTHDLPPFAQMDKIGLDVIQAIEEHYANESGDPADLPPPILTDKVARGDLGQKTGRGFYRYPNPEYAESDFLLPDG